MTTCTGWSLTSAFSAYRCGLPAHRYGLCAPHLHYPDRPTTLRTTAALEATR